MSRDAARVGALILGALLVAGCGSVSASAGGSASSRVTVEAAISGETYELVDDNVRGVLWYSTFSGTAVELHEFSKVGGKQVSYELGPSGASGIVSHTRLGADGHVWVSDDYRMYEFNPEDQSVSKFDIPLEVSGQLPAATDVNAALPGTWISAFGLTKSGDVILARNNVPFLEQRTQSGTLISVHKLQDGFDGLSDMAVFATAAEVLPGHSNVNALGEIPLSLQGSLDDLQGLVPSPFLRGSFFGDLQVYFNNGAHFLYKKSGEADWVQTNGTTVSVDLPSHQTDISNPLGQSQTVSVHPSVEAAAQSGGDLWLVESGPDGGSLVRISSP